MTEGCQMESKKTQARQQTYVESAGDHLLVLAMTATSAPCRIAILNFSMMTMLM